MPYCDRTKNTFKLKSSIIINCTIRGFGYTYSYTITLGPSIELEKFLFYSVHVVKHLEVRGPLNLDGRGPRGQRSRSQALCVCSAIYI